MENLHSYDGNHERIIKFNWLFKFGQETPKKKLAVQYNSSINILRQGVLTNLFLSYGNDQWNISTLNKISTLLRQFNRSLFRSWIVINFSSSQVSSKFGVYKFLVFSEILVHRLKPPILDYTNRECQPTMLSRLVMLKKNKRAFTS